jgi:hypothetical protein
MVVILTSCGPVHQPALYAQKIITGQYLIKFLSSSIQSQRDLSNGFQSCKFGKYLPRSTNENIQDYKSIHCTHNRFNYQKEL